MEDSAGKLQRSTEPTGEIQRQGGRLSLVIRRDVHAPIDVVWAAIATSEGLNHWIGPFTGDPDEGSVTFWMFSEGMDVDGLTTEIRVCEAPTRLSVAMWDPHVEPDSQYAISWHLDFELVDRGGTTRLTLREPDIDATQAHVDGPFFEYCLDHMTAYVTAGVAERVVDTRRDPGPLTEHYRVASD